MKSKHLKVLLTALVMAIGGITAHAEEIDENALFGDPGATVQELAAAPEAKEENSTKLTGEITSVFSSSELRVSTSSPLASYIVGNIFLDIRMQKGLKALANVEAAYVGSNRTTLVNVRELFFDFNLDRRIYFRTGKQVLQWGRCYFWNPTDLINVEKKSFIQKIGYREGAYGLKFHAPFGTKYNIYGFIDTGNAQESDDLGAAGKFEFLAGNTEMAFAAWGKRGYEPVWGYDVSSRLFGLDVLGEVSVSKGDNYDKVREEGGVLTLGRSDDWTPRAAVSLGKYFDTPDINDRISVIGEFFYNHAGYDEDIFNDATVYPFASPVAVPNPAGGTLSVAAGTRKDLLLYNNLYEQHHLAKYYAALFASLRRFIVTDMTLNLNYIRNLYDGSGILSAGVQYKDLNDFSYGLLVNTYLGKDDREYTYSGDLFNVQATFGISF